MTYTTPTEPEHGPELDATDARQGRWGRHMLWVLLAGLLLVVIALGGTWAYRSGDLQAADDKARTTAEESHQANSALLPAKNRAAEEPPAP
jgi:hypothetical protein